MTPHTIESLVVEWKFARDDRKRLVMEALRAACTEFRAQELLDEIEKQLVERAPGESFDLGDGTRVTIGIPMLVTESPLPDPQNTPQNEPNSLLPHNV